MGRLPRCAGEIETGKIKSRNDRAVFVVYRCNNEWNRFSEFTAAATDPSDLTFRKTMILSHRTNAADAILRDGFRDGEGSYLLEGMTLRGVFVSDMPLDSNEEQLESSFWRSHCLPSAIFQITS